MRKRNKLVNSRRIFAICFCFFMVFSIGYSLIGTNSNSFTLIPINDDDGNDGNDNPMELPTETLIDDDPEIELQTESVATETFYYGSGGTDTDNLVEMAMNHTTTNDVDLKTGTTSMMIPVGWTANDFYCRVDDVEEVGNWVHDPTCTSAYWNYAEVAEAWKNDDFTGDTNSDRLNIHMNGQDTTKTNDDWDFTDGASYPDWSLSGVQHEHSSDNSNPPYRDGNNAYTYYYRSGSGSETNSWSQDVYFSPDAGDVEAYRMELRFAGRIQANIMGQIEGNVWSRTRVYVESSSPDRSYEVSDNNAQNIGDTLVYTTASHGSMMTSVNSKGFANIEFQQEVYVSAAGDLPWPLGEEDGEGWCWMGEFELTIFYREKINQGSEVYWQLLSGASGTNTFGFGTREITDVDISMTYNASPVLTTGLYYPFIQFYTAGGSASSRYRLANASTPTTRIDTFNNWSDDNVVLYSPSETDVKFWFNGKEDSGDSGAFYIRLGIYCQTGDTVLPSLRDFYFDNVNVTFTSLINCSAGPPPRRSIQIFLTGGGLSEGWAYYGGSGYVSDYKVLPTPETGSGSPGTLLTVDYGISGLDLFSVTGDVYTSINLTRTANVSYNFTITNDGNGIIDDEVTWWMHYQCDTIDEDYLDSWRFKFYTPADWNQTLGRFYIPQAAHEYDFPNSQRLDETGAPGDEIEYTAIQQYTEDTLNMRTNEYYWDIRFKAPNYLPDDASVKIGWNGGANDNTYFPTNATDITTIINRPGWLDISTWRYSYLNVTVARQTNDTAHDVYETWEKSFNTVDHQSIDNNTHDWTINSSATGSYVVLVELNNSHDDGNGQQIITEVGFNNEVLEVWRNTTVDTSAIIKTSQEVLDGDLVNYTLTWEDLNDRDGNSQPDDNVTASLPYIKIYSDQQGNLTNTALTWKLKLGTAGVVDTDITSIVNVTEIANGKYKFVINTSSWQYQMAKYTGAGNRTVVISLQRPYHETINITTWIFITARTQFDWITPSESTYLPGEPIWGSEPDKIIQGSGYTTEFRIIDLSRMEYEENYATSEELQTEGYEAIYINNATTHTAGLVDFTFDCVNDTIFGWINEGVSGNVSYANNDWDPGIITSMSSGLTMHYFKIPDDCPETYSIPVDFIFINYTWTITNTTTERYQSGHLVNVSQDAFPAIDRKTGCMRFRTELARTVVQTVLAFNDTISYLIANNLTWQPTYDGYGGKWTVKNIYWNESGEHNASIWYEGSDTPSVNFGDFLWRDGFMMFNLTFANDSIAGDPDINPVFPSSNGSIWIDNSTNGYRHYENVTFNYTATQMDDPGVDWMTLSDPLKCEQILGVSGLNSTYNMTLNVSSVPKITKFGTTYRFNVYFDVDTTEGLYRWEDGRFQFDIQILPQKSLFLASTGDITPSAPFWGENISLETTYRDTTNDVLVDNASGEVRVDWSIYYYQDATPVTVCTGVMNENASDPGKYINDPIVTADYSGFNLEDVMYPTQKKFFFAYTASKQRQTGYAFYYVQESANVTSFYLKPREIDISPPDSIINPTNFGWQDTVDVVLDDVYYFSLNLNETAYFNYTEIENVNVSWKRADLPDITKIYAMSNANGTVNFAVNVSKGDYSADVERTIEIRAEKRNYILDDLVLWFKVNPIYIPVELRVHNSKEATGHLSTRQSEALSFSFDLCDVSYADVLNYTLDRKELIKTDAIVRFRLETVGEVIYGPIQMEPVKFSNGTNTGEYTGSIDPWTSLFAPMEPGQYFMYVEVFIYDSSYDRLEFDDSTCRKTFYLETDGFMQVYSFPFLIALIGAVGLASIYMTIHGIRILRVPYVLRMIENTNKKINRNRKTHAGVMKSREQQIVEQAEVELKVFGIKLEPLSAKKLPPPITKRAKKEDDLKFESLTDEEITLELEKLKDLSSEEKMLFSKEIKDLTPKDQREFLVGLGASPDLLKIPEKGKKGKKKPEKKKKEPKK